MKTDPKVLEAIGRFSEAVGSLDPRIRDLLEQLRLGRSEEEVLADLAKLVSEDTELSRKIEKAAQENLKPLRAESSEDVREAITALRKLPDRQEALKNLNFEEEDLLFHPEGAALPQLHPVIAAHIIERLQFDDDIPELRTGDLPIGAPPAVPIENPARDPVALGKQLEQASKEVRAELDQKHLEKMAQLEALEPDLQAGSEALVAKTKGDFVAVSEGRVGIPGYQAGHKAALRKVDPDIQSLATLTEEQRSRYAYKALTSTQGRRSAAPLIGAMVKEELSQKGYTVTLNGPEPLLEIEVATAEWTIRIDASADETQYRFALIDTAAKVLSIRLDRELKSLEIDQILLHVQPINEISRRLVGWEAKVAVCQ